MNEREMMGYESESDRRVPVAVRDWNALKLALWRSKTAWEFAEREAELIVSRCAHSAGCPGEKAETDPCLSSCPDREQRMSALVVLNAARTLAPVDARRSANDPYMAPSREYFSEVMATLAAAQVELETLHEVLRAEGVPAPGAPTLPAPAQFEPLQLDEPA